LRIAIQAENIKSGKLRQERKQREYIISGVRTHKHFGIVADKKAETMYPMQQSSNPSKQQEKKEKPSSRV